MRISTNEITRKPPKRWWKWTKRFLLLCFLGITMMVASIVFYVFINLRNLPEVNSERLKTYEPTKILDSKGNIIYQTTSKHVGIMTYNEIPDLYKKSLIAVEDENFWENKGYSTAGVINMVTSVLLNKINPNITVRGGSTLDQQLIKNAYFNGGRNVKTTTRKIQEIYLAQQLDHNFSKQEILTFYVNHLEYAEGDTGVKSVMMTSFGKTPEDYKDKTTENIAETAYLVGLGQNPTIYNLYVNPKAGNARKNTVLSVMKEKGYITKSEYQKAKAYDVTNGLKPRYWEAEKQNAQNLKYKTYTDQVLNNIKSMGYNTEDVSLQVHTFLNPDIYDNITNTVRQDKYYQDGSNRDNPVQIGVTVMNKDGIVEGMVGSRIEGDENNRAIQRTRSSGSSMKAFTAYGPLLQYLGNSYTTQSQFDSSAYLYPGTNTYMNNWGKETYGMVDMQKAMRLSLNTVVGRIDDNILGSNRMKSFLHSVNLDVKDVYSSVDGIGINISSLDAAAAYNALNNGGIYIKPRFINYIEFSDGSKKTIPEEQYRAMNSSTAFVLLQMMRGVVQDGYTAKDAKIDQYQGYAAKTGTVGLHDGSTSPNVYGDGGTDAWFDSVTNNGYSIAIWTGYDNPNTSPQIADDFKGIQYMGKDLQLMLNGNKSISNWAQPEGVRHLNGSNLNANYAVTDSKDINNNDITTVQDLTDNYFNLKSVTKAEPEKKINDWTKKIASEYKKFYDIWKNDNSVLNNKNILNHDVYDSLKGSE